MENDWSGGIKSNHDEESSYMYIVCCHSEFRLLSLGHYVLLFSNFIWSPKFCDNLTRDSDIWTKFHYSRIYVLGDDRPVLHHMFIWAPFNPILRWITTEEKLQLLLIFSVCFRGSHSHPVPISSIPSCIITMSILPNYCS